MILSRVLFLSEQCRYKKLLLDAKLGIKSLHFDVDFDMQSCRHQATNKNFIRPSS